MSPDQLAAKGTESGSQKALFAWAAMAEHYGFTVAGNMTAYSAQGLQVAIAKLCGQYYSVKELEWLHAIPNGGNRDARTAALMKAEGVRRGIADVFLPVPKEQRGPTGAWITISHGLYIEMKKDVTSAKQSDEQEEFEAHCVRNRYAYYVCKSWREAAEIIKNYLT